MLFSRKEKLDELKAKSSLNIFIVGCGRVGSAILEQLNKENHTITVIDGNQEIINEISNMYDIMAIYGNGASFTVLKEAGIKEADLLIAVTDSDEFNLLCCTIANTISNCATIARIMNPEYSVDARQIRAKLGLDMVINPAYEATREMFNILCLPTVLEVSSFASGSVELIKIKIREGNMLDGLSVAELGSRIDNVLIGAVERKKQIIIPSGDFKLQAGDFVSIILPKRKVSSFLKQIGFKTNKVKSAMIIGGGDTGYYLAKQLCDADISVKLIEKDAKRCDYLATMLPKAIVINGNGTDSDLLIEEGIESIEAFVPITGSDEENILLSLHAKQISTAKIITQISRLTFKDAINNLDLDSIVYPRYITCEEIIAYVRAKSASVGSNVESIFHMFDNRVEAIEFKIDIESKVTNRPIMKLNLKKDLLIASIIRNGKVIIPSGQDMLLPGDKVIIVTTHTGFKDISNILA